MKKKVNESYMKTIEKKFEQKGTMDEISIEQIPHPEPLHFPD